MKQQEEGEMYLLKSASEATEEPLFTRLPPTLMAYPDREGARFVYKNGFAEKDVLRWVADYFIQPDKAFLDIGAHIGTYSWTIAPLASHTYSFECSPKTFCYLATNIALKGLEYKITPLPFALGDKEGEIDYIVRSGEGGDNGVKALSTADDSCFKVRVPMRTLDSFGLRNIGFIKIDVEGFEKEVLQGGLETLRESGWPKILFESWSDHLNREIDTKKIREDLFAFLSSIGYTWVPVRGTSDMFIAEHP